LITITVTTDVATCRMLRRVVFIEEQGVSEADEVDDKDAQAVHLLAQRNGQPVGTARLLRSGDTGKIGRVCVLAAARGQGLGAALIHAAVAEFRRDRAIARVELGAQVHALGFYQALGFAAFGPVYVDAGIDHRDMALVL
jgi:predicted GNAT family N-acyltransferase